MAEVMWLKSKALHLLRLNARMCSNFGMKQVSGSASEDSAMKLDNSSESSDLEIPHYLDGEDLDTLRTISRDMIVHENFITEAEEKSLLDEVDPYMKRLKYEHDHWDDAIHGYRETEKANWKNDNRAILTRVHNSAFSSETPLLRFVHVLDLAKTGYIKPHVDSVRFCGPTIAGLCLLSSCVMRLVNEENKSIWVDVLLKQRSLYIMKGEARYKYTHEVLEDTKSFFKGEHIPRDRRISIMCRNEPLPEDSQK